MKLSKLEIEQVQAQTTVEPMLGDHPAMTHLKTYIGDHSFYIGSEGVFIWEYVSDDEKKGERINALRVASWADPGNRTIAIHNPQLTETIISLSEDPSIKASEGPGIKPSEGPGIKPSEDPSIKASKDPGIKPSKDPGIKPSKDSSIKKSVLEDILARTKMVLEKGTADSSD